MPTYDYRCEKCDKVFEEFHGMTEDPKVLCPDCGGEAKKMIGGGLGVIFKGSGFYVTDNKGAAKSAAPGKTESKKENTSSSDSKDSGSGGDKKGKKEPAKV